MLDKAILHGKEHRQPYYKKSKRIDPTCRNHGSCDYCRQNRAWKFRDKHYSEREIMAESRYEKRGETNV